MSASLEIDIDDRENISSIQNIISDDEYFYILANKKDAKLGYFLLSIEIDNPSNDSEYLIKWSNKLDIGNCDMHILTEVIDGETQKSIVISYKSIGINTFNLFVIDLKTKLI